MDQILNWRAQESLNGSQAMFSGFRQPTVKALGCDMGPTMEEEFMRPQKGKGYRTKSRTTEM